ncbi:MAG TPA: class I SAM-dependent methyltransferase [Micromonosporaceae bacterium]
MTSGSGLPAGLGRALALLADARAVPDVSAGYLDLVASRPAGRRSLAQRLMSSRLVPRVYEQWWRPALGWVAKGPRGPDMDAEQRIASDYLAVSPGDVVLDLACGPGNFTRRFATLVGPDGLVVGQDMSTTMLERAVRDTFAGTGDRFANLGYFRADAADLPFLDRSFDAVCCFAALHLFGEPLRVLDQIARVLRPGGRIALMASCRRGPGPVRSAASLAMGATGVRMFGPDELTSALRERGFGELRQRISGMVQFVGGTRERPDRPPTP